MTDLNRSELESVDISSEVAPTFANDSVPGIERVNGPRRKSTKGKWTSEEDQLLRDAVDKYKGKKWKKIAECVFGSNEERNDVKCQNRWQKVLNPSLNKGPWKKEEDDVLSRLVKGNMEKGTKAQWSNISKKLPGRNGKQCRERWYNHLNPTIIKTPWTKEEELILVQAQSEHGNKWAGITKLLPGRTENNIKNHWNCSVKKRLDQFASILPSGVVDGSRPCGSESNFVNHSKTMVESHVLTSQFKEAAKSPQRNSLEETSGPMNRRNEPSSTSALREDKSISSSKEPELPRLNVSNSLKPRRRRNGNVRLPEVVSKFIETVRKRAATFELPSIISKRSSPAHGLERHREKDGTPIQRDADPSQMASEEKHTVITSPLSKHRSVSRNTACGSKPLERRLEFDSV